ncbi:MalM family protein [Vibrio algivorus]|uniref:Lipoprotein n=1 Tax=Vibrio algivorus TaxID=1667024 RepID=A0A557NX20_9VIBR|nr:MalM family protein [Vibrio algivorus]TVO32966.1 hypothetical protein FOF44_16345 [Vibrio algivorus]
MKKILTLSVLLALAGCADKNGNIFNPNLFGGDKAETTAEDVKNVSDMQSVSITTNSFSDIEVIYLASNKTVSFSLSQEDAVMQLDSGKTFVQVFALPQLEFDQGIRVISEARETVVVPYLQYLDGEFKAVGEEVAAEYITKYDQFNLVAPVSDMSKTIRYVAIYSHQDDYGKQTQLYDAEQAYNKTNGIDQPAKPWLKTTHTPVGNLTIKLERITDQ